MGVEVCHAKGWGSKASFLASNKTQGNHIFDVGYPWQRVSAERNSGRSLRFGGGSLGRRFGEVWGDVSGEVWGEVFAEVFGLVLLGHSEQTKKLNSV